MNQLDYSLSFSDIKNIYPEAKLIPYSEIIDYDNIFDLIGDTGKCIILYLFTETSGHYVALFIRGNKISYFDSYGFPPEEAYKFMKREARHLNQDQPYLFELMHKSGKKFEYNPYQIQKWESGMNTCGKHCIVRIANDHLTPEQYYKKISKIQQETGLSFDQIVNNIFTNSM